MKKNIVLVGMPGAGKSTIGVVLAKVLGYSFIDSDLVIQEQENRLLKDIILEDGLEAFLSIEDKANAKIEAEHSVIATGGSVIYGQQAMKHLKEIGIVVYIKLSYETILERLGDITERGVALKEGQNLYSLYEERCPLYDKYADITVDGEEKSIREMVATIVEQLGIHTENI